MSETTQKRPRRTAAEIAQAHADKAVEKLKKHDEKIERAKEKVAKAQAELGDLDAERDELVAEADYRQAHPALRNAGKDVGRPVEPEFESDDKPEPKQDDEEFNPFA